MGALVGLVDHLGGDDDVVMASACSMLWWNLSRDWSIFNGDGVGVGLSSRDGFDDLKLSIKSGAVDSGFLAREASEFGTLEWNVKNESWSKDVGNTVG